MSDYAPRNLAELRAAIGHGSPVAAGRFRQIKGQTVNVGTSPSEFADMVGPLADDVRASAAEYRRQYMAGEGRARPLGSVAYVVSAWTSSRHGTGWHPFAAILADGDTWSTVVWPDARSSISGLTQGVYDAATGGVDAFTASLNRWAKEPGDY